MGNNNVTDAKLTGKNPATDTVIKFKEVRSIMRSVRFLSKIGSLISVLIIVLLTGCGSSSTTSIAPASGAYLVEYVPGTTAAAVGKTTFQIRVSKRSDSSAATGLASSITLNPMMDMGGGMKHSTPVDIISEETGTAGTYDCTIYYLMDGTWQLEVKIGSETTTFSPSVSMAMTDDDTTKKSMYGTSDIVVSGMTGTQYNYYFLFNDGMVSASTPTFKLYIAQTVDNKMTFNPLSMVSSPTGTVASAVVSASTDSTFTSGTVTASDDGNGHWSLSNISDLSTAGTYTVYVKLQVGSEDKTTNGTTPYAAFKVTSHN
jgi:hypothetical protein